MLKPFRLPQKLRTSLLKSGVTGEIGAHGSADNLAAINRLLKADPYVTFGIEAVEQAVQNRQFSLAQVVEIMAASLGYSPERFRRPGPGFIDPKQTARQMEQMLDRVGQVARQGGLFVLATAHPGSLLAHYTRLAGFIAQHSGRVYQQPGLVKVGDYRWIDQVSGVHVLSDEGGLLHTHDSQGFAQFLATLPEAPAIVLADHGFAGAAINAGLPTIAIHDVDDPGLPLAAHLGRDVLLVPMNDNQLNLPTLAALQAMLNHQ